MVKVEGKAYIFGDNIDTDQIYPGRYLELTDKKDIAMHCMEGVRPEFASSVKIGDIVIASRNFGCGSSREHAAITLKESGVGAVLADSFARIFYRNAINLGLPVVVCKGISERVSEGDTLKVDIKSGVIENVTKGQMLQGEGLSEDVMNILEAGGIKPLMLAAFREKD